MYKFMLELISLVTLVVSTVPGSSDDLHGFVLPPPKNRNDDTLKNYKSRCYLGAKKHCTALGMSEQKGEGCCAKGSLISRGPLVKPSRDMHMHMSLHEDTRGVIFHRLKNTMRFEVFGPSWCDLSLSWNTP